MNEYRYINIEINKIKVAMRNFIKNFKIKITNDNKKTKK